MSQGTRTSAGRLDLPDNATGSGVLIAWKVRKVHQLAGLLFPKLLNTQRNIESTTATIMSTPSPTGFYYTLESYEPSIQVEFYFPQPALKLHLPTILGSGFVPDKVKAHFLGENGDLTSPTSLKVLEFVRRNASDASKEKVKQAVARLRTLGWGYSSYTVAGAWRANDLEKPVEELTDVIRAIFRFDGDNLLRELGGVQDGELTGKAPAIRQMIEDAIHSHPTLPMPKGSPDLERVFKDVRLWQGDITFFAFGFIQYRVWEAIKKNREAIPSVEPEQEIWTTFNPNVRVRRVLLQNADAPPASTSS